MNPLLLSLSRSILLFCLVLLIPDANSADRTFLPDEKKKTEKRSSATFGGLKFRSIGPALPSGRIIDFAVNPAKPANYFVAVASGGVWKTTNSGTTWKPVFDSRKSYSIGCITMDPNNPHVIWVGTGENNSQRSVSYGDGVYRSSDGGKSWKNMGLGKSEHIGKILVHPGQSNIVYVAAQGPLWGPGGDRGLYKTTDAGKTWSPVLVIGENTGVTDMVMDPRDPDVLYAASYQRRRHVWTLINGGPESALYKTTDGGKSWDTLRSGIPKVDLGRIGLAISPVHPDIIYAIIEAAEKKGGFFRSTDRGASWTKQSDYVCRSPQYYQEIVCDPIDVNRVFVLDTWTSVSDDGGKTFKRLGNKHRHVDDHALWIDPDNTDYLLIGGDGGVYESWDRGRNWRFKENLPVTQFYRVSVDNAKPFYNVYGGTQDNSSLGGPSRTLKSDGIMNEDWFFTYGGDGFETQIDPKDPNIVYAQSQYGVIARYDKKSGERKGIQPMPGEGEEAYRWNWDSPLLISPHSNTRLYFAANKLFRSEDRGDSWETISPDLTRQIDRNTLPVMGRIWGPDAVSKNASTSLYGNIVALTESPLFEGLLYVGTDDGLIRITEDGGRNWRKIESVPGVPEFTYVSFLMASQHDENVVYAAFDNHKMADFHPYIYKSADRGRTWSAITGNLPANGPVYALAEDHIRKDLLFAGTEFGVFFSAKGGGEWIRLKNGLPTIAVKDLAIQKRENDLVLATFGRGFYILDNYAPLRDFSEDVEKKDAHLFPVDDALMYIQSRSRRIGSQGGSFYAAKNPPFGATFTYYLGRVPKTRKATRKEARKKKSGSGEEVPYPAFDELRAEEEEESPWLQFTIRDAEGNIVRRLRSSAAKGIQRITWNLRYGSVSPVSSGTDINKQSGMLSMPGKYSVLMEMFRDGESIMTAGPVLFNAVVLNNTSLPAEDRALLVAFQKKVARLQRAVLGTRSSANELNARIKVLGTAIQLAQAPNEDLVRRQLHLKKEVTSILRELNGDPVIASRHGNQPPAIYHRLQRLIGAMWASTSDPGRSQLEAYEIVNRQFIPVLDRLRRLVETDLPDLESRLEDSGAPWTPGRVPKWDGR